MNTRNHSGPFIDNGRVSTATGLESGWIKSALTQTGDKLQRNRSPPRQIFSPVEIAGKQRRRERLRHILRGNSVRFAFWTRLTCP